MKQNNFKQKSRFEYSESQGDNRDKEILERYKIIIDYYAENLDRILDNSAILLALHNSDAILNKDKSLKKTLCEMLMHSFPASKK